MKKKLVNYIKQFNKPFEVVKTEFSKEFYDVYEGSRSQNWYLPLEQKINLINNPETAKAIESTIFHLKDQAYQFKESDTPSLTLFISNINNIVKITNWINNFKEGKILEDGTNLRLHELFNRIKVSHKLDDLKCTLTPQLKSYLPHLYSIIKNCQNPIEYPINYRYWRSIIKEVLGKTDDYDSLTLFYRTFPQTKRPLNFASYVGAIGANIIKNLNPISLNVLPNSSNYKYLTDKVITLSEYKKLLSQKLQVHKINKEKRYWLYAPGKGAKYWEEYYDKGIIGLGWDELEDLDEYDSKEEIQERLESLHNDGVNKSLSAEANFNFKEDISIGDIVFAKKGLSAYLGYGVVTSEYFYDNEKETHQKCRKIEWKKKGSWSANKVKLVQIALKEITKKNADYLLKIMNGKINDMNYPLNTIFYGPPGTGKTYNTVLRAAEIIENRIIEDYEEAKEIFKKHLHNRIEFITFHQNYSYEDFIQGLRPDVENDKELTFERRDGVFKVLSDKALNNLKEARQPELAKLDFERVFQDFISPIVEGEEDEIEVQMKKSSFFITQITNRSIEFRKNRGESQHTLSINTLRKMYEKEGSDIIVGGLQVYYGPILNQLLTIGKAQISRVEEKNYVIIIDEINRANISRVFGELITLIEPDKRYGGKLPLEVQLPSGELFSVPSNLYLIGTMNTADKSIALLDIALRRRFEFEAMYPKYEIVGQEIYDTDILKNINDQIIKTKGHDFQIGHAYFMGDNKDLVSRMNKKVIPLLLEYYMNDDKEVKNILTKANLEVDNTYPLTIKGRRD